jgi:hypothetical protein
MKPLIKILLLASLAALPALAATPAQGAKHMEAATQDDGVFIYNDDIGREAALRAARSMGITTLRLNILWWQAVPLSQRNSANVPANPAYNFSLWDAAIKRAKAYGIKSQIDLAGDPPTYACGNKRAPYDCDGYKPNVKLWKDFVGAAAAHFKHKVKRYSLWNEPNWYTWISPHKRAPLIYRKLLQTGYKAIKRKNKKAEVVAGELAPHFQKGISTPPLQFIREMVCVKKNLKPIKGAKKKCKGKLKFDAFATHPYDFEHKPLKKRANKDELTVANLPALTKLLGKLRKKGRITTKKKKFPIYLTEYGYMVGTNPAVRQERRFPEAKRAKWLVQAWQRAADTPRIKQMMHYDFVSSPLGSPDGYFDMGLLQNNGVPRQSYFSLRNWIQQAVAKGEVKRPGACSAC